MADKRQEIIKAAAPLLLEKGYMHTSLSDILAAADIGKGQFYHYFPSKYALGLAVVEHRFTVFTEQLLNNVLGAPKTGQARFDAMLDWVIAAHQKCSPNQGCFFGNLALEMSGQDEGFRLLLMRVFETWAERIDDALQDISNTADAPPDERKQLARTVVAMIEGGILATKSYQDINMLKTSIAAIRRLIGTYKSNCPPTE